MSRQATPRSRRNSLTSRPSPQPAAPKSNNGNSQNEELYTLQQQDAAELAFSVQRERSDRLYVERLFAVREEHHARSRLYQQEIHERELVATASTFAHTLRLEAERHRSEMDALRTTLEKKNGIGSLQRDVRFGLHALSAEQDALTQLAAAAEAHEGQMKSAMTSEKLAWEGEKTQLLRRIGDLELAIQASRGEEEAQRNSNNNYRHQHENQHHAAAAVGQGEQERIIEEKQKAESALRRADEAWAQAKSAQNHNSNNNNNMTPPPSTRGVLILPFVFLQ